jgi:hypothetical protein
VRAGALSDKEVGAYVAEHYVSTWKRVGTFTVVQKDGKAVARAGGNVAIYFCTPELEVVHAIAGPVGAKAFLAEAKWAVEAWTAAAEKAGGDREKLAAALREAHAKRAADRRQACVSSLGAVYSARKLPAAKLQEDLGAGARQEATKALEKVLGERAERPAADLLYRRAIELQRDDATVLVEALMLSCEGGGLHRLLAEKGLPKLDEVYRHVFERVLGERVTDTPVRVVESPAARIRGMAAGDDVRKKLDDALKQIEELRKQIQELKESKKVE